MPVGDEDVAIRGDQHIRRTVELVGSVAGNARLAERPQQAAIRAELHDSLICAVGNPDCSVRGRAQAVRPLEQAGAKARN